MFARKSERFIELPFLDRRESKHFAEHPFRGWGFISQRFEFVKMFSILPIQNLYYDNCYVAIALHYFIYTSLFFYH